MNCQCADIIIQQKRLIAITAMCSAWYVIFTLFCFMTLTQSYLCQNCLQCQSRFFNLCTTCKDGFYLTRSLTCERCNLQCRTCDSYQRQCLSCFPSNYLSEGVCYPCSYDCESCISSNECTKCAWLDSYLLNGSCDFCDKLCQKCVDHIGCLSCISSFYLFNESCFQCPQNCARCWNSTSCKQCYLHYFMNNNSLCQSCGSNCLSCVDGLGCYSCTASFYLLNRSCQLCPSNCYCADGLGCIECKYDSESLLNGTCSTKDTIGTSDNGIDDGQIVAIVFGNAFGITIFILLCKYCCSQPQEPSAEPPRPAVPAEVPRPAYHAFPPAYHAFPPRPALPSYDIYPQPAGPAAPVLPAELAQPAFHALPEPPRGPTPIWDLVVLNDQNSFGIASSRYLRGKNPEKRRQELCPVCLAEDSNTILEQCGHALHPKCLAQWMNRNPHSPLCRGPLRTEDLKCSASDVIGVALSGLCHKSVRQLLPKKVWYVLCRM